MAYADVSDLTARWRTLTEDEQARAAVLLEDASAMLAAAAMVDESDAQQYTLLKIVCCNMVQRAMSTGGDMFGVSQQSITAGPYTESFSYSNPSGDMYITKAEKRMLGISGTGKGRTLMYGMAGDRDARC